MGFELVFELMGLFFVVLELLFVGVGEFVSFMEVMVELLVFHIHLIECLF